MQLFSVLHSIIQWGIINFAMASGKLLLLLFPLFCWGIFHIGGQRCTRLTSFSSSADGMSTVQRPCQKDDVQTWATLKPGPARLIITAGLGTLQPFHLLHTFLASGWVSISKAALAWPVALETGVTAMFERPLFHQRWNVRWHRHLHLCSKISSFFITRSFSQYDPLICLTVDQPKAHLLITVRDKYPVSRLISLLFWV